jgi:hypothetical protein
MATLGPGMAAIFIGPAADCTVEHSPHRNSLCVVMAIEEEAAHHDGHTVLCRAQDGMVGYARPDELRPLDEWGVDVTEHQEIPAEAGVS